MKPNKPILRKPYGHQRRKHGLPPIAELRKRFQYNPETGEMRGPSGRVLKAKHNKGYLIVTIVSAPRVITLQHRMAFALTVGRWPHMIDHINRDKSDNRWSNLREVTASENQWNRAATHIRAGTHSTGRRVWYTQMRLHGTPRTTVRSTFCGAWKLRQRWLRERD